MPGFFKGMLIGFSIAAPVGPIGVLCIRRSLARGRWVGFASGLGAATADAGYALVAALGLTAVTRVLVEQTFWLQAMGGGFMLCLGIATLRSRPPAKEAAASNQAGFGSAFASTLALTVTNPMTILSFAGIFAGLGAGAFSGGTMVAGVFLGSAGWWLLLSTGASWFSSRLHGGGLRVVNIVSGLVIAGFGAWQLVRLGLKS